LFLVKIGDNQQKVCMETEKYEIIQFIGPTKCAVLMTIHKY
jgi:hypothetical protein